MYTVFTNVWFGGGYGIFSDPDGDRRHFNRDVYGIWFTILLYLITRLNGLTFDLLKTFPNRLLRCEIVLNHNT